MNLLYLKLKLRLLPWMLCVAVLGALVGGAYGVLHDQVTYSISPEYFTKLKFHQFHYADFGFPKRIFVSEVGFLATWWVGFLSAWFLAVIAFPAWSRRLAFQRCLFGFLIIFVSGFTAAAIGCLLGFLHSPDHSSWLGLCETIGVVDIPNFVRVAYIHNASYIGGLIGLICAIFHLLSLRNRRAGG